MAVAVTGRAASSLSRDEGMGRSRIARAGVGVGGRRRRWRWASRRLPTSTGSSSSAPGVLGTIKDREPGRGHDRQGAAQPPAGTQVPQAQGPADHPDRRRAGGCQLQPAAGPQVGERLVGVAIADGGTDLPILRIALADHLGELGVAAADLVDELVPAAGADRLGLLGVPNGADAGRPGRLKQGSHAVGVHHGGLLDQHHPLPLRLEVPGGGGATEGLHGPAAVQPEVAGGAAGGLGGGDDYFNPSRLAKSPSGDP
jgi:hypothetical protein